MTNKSLNVGLRFKQVRQLLKKSQQSLADDLNITKQAISNIENGKCSPSISLLGKLLVDYNINLNYLIGGKGSILLVDEAGGESLKQSIISEVEKMLVERGIV
ncbi:helix-turn-helix domain-containing protein [bacterium]|nr:helix-turn-helix domain-containing protein [bacterium]